MLNRRLILLFILFFLGAAALTIRLAKLQISQADAWRSEMRKFVHRHTPIETYRGAILDRNGKVLAKDDACDDLAIDYRAMNFDDRWIAATARARLKDVRFNSSAERLQAIRAEKEKNAAQIDAIPAAISQVCKIPIEDVHARFNEIRARIDALHQNLWTRPMERDPNRRGQTDEELDADYQDAELKEEHSANTVIHNISPEVATYFRQHKAEFPGLEIPGDATRRLYPYNDIACHIIGTLRSVDADTIKADKFERPNLLTESDPGNLHGYLPADLMGEAGAEKILEPRLRGSRGVRLDELGQPRNADAPRIAPTPGQNVKLTLDIELQRDLHNAIADPARGLRLSDPDKKQRCVAVVVMAVDTGEILAMLSWPTYNLNAIDDLRPQLNADNWQRPLRNRALDAYPPGSTVKPLLAAAGLTERVINPSETITCTQHFFPNRTGVFRCLELHGDIQLVNAIAESCNIYFYTVGQRLNLERLTRWYSAYGIGRDTGCELPEQTGSLANLQNYTDADEAFRESLFEGIGQGRITATPLQMANACATLLRGGLAIQPRIVADSPLKSAQVFNLSPDTLAAVRKGMERCTIAGTGKSVFRDLKLAVAGKTGTAETPTRLLFDDAGNPEYDPAKPVLNPDGSPKLGPDNKPLFKQMLARGTDAWFVGYAPADNPKFVVAAIMEWGGHGAKAAAPLVKESFLQLQRHGYLPKLDVP